MQQTATATKLTRPLSKKSDGHCGFICTMQCSPLDSNTKRVLWNTQNLQSLQVFKVVVSFPAFGCTWTVVSFQEKTQLLKTVADRSYLYIPKCLLNPYSSIIPYSKCWYHESNSGIALDPSDTTLQWFNPCGHLKKSTPPHQQQRVRGK